MYLASVFYNEKKIRKMTLKYVFPKLVDWLLKKFNFSFILDRRR